jgi:hypothetical protein
MSALRVYVAGPSPRCASIAVLLATLRGHGAVITFDWPARLMADQGRALTDADRSDIATRCQYGVLDADLFWIVLDTEKSEGAHAELGMAIALRAMGAKVEIVASGPLDGSRVFPAEANRRFDQHEKALGYVLERVKAAA